MVRGAYIECTHSLKLEGSDDVGGQLLCVCQRDAHHAVRLRAARRPVLEARQRCVTCVTAQHSLQLHPYWHKFNS